MGLFYFCQNVVFESLIQLPKHKNQEIRIKLGVYSFFANKYIWLCRACIPTGQSFIGVAWLGRIPSSFLSPHPTLLLTYVLLGAGGDSRGTAKTKIKHKTSIKKGVPSVDSCSLVSCLPRRAIPSLKPVSSLFFFRALLFLVCHL